MEHVVATLGELAALTLAGPPDTAHPLVTVDLHQRVDGSTVAGLRARLLAAPYVVIGVGSRETHDTPLGHLVDVALDPDDPTDASRFEAAVTNITANPIAAAALAVLLRTATGLPPLAGVAAESMTYSTLQAGPEFARWLAARPHPRSPTTPEAGPAVRVVELGDGLEVVLSRSHRHNAIDKRLRLELHDALRVAAAGSRSVRLRGAGPSFSSGGDLAEFGSFADPATAHLVRMASHPAAAMIELGPARTSAHVHGAVAGAGLEIAAYAGRVTASPDAWLQLPELGLGLVPGAGGTVSVRRRIGRRRTALLALTMERLDPATALAWGLIDVIE